MNDVTQYCEECGNEVLHGDINICEECELDHFLSGIIQCSVCCCSATWEILGVYLCEDCTLEEYERGIRYD